MYIKYGENITNMSLSYIRMVVVPWGRCHLFVVVLVSPIVLMRVGDIAVAQWSINFVVSLLYRVMDVLCFL